MARERVAAMLESTNAMSAAVAELESSLQSLLIERAELRATVSALEEMLESARQENDGLQQALGGRANVGRTSNEPAESTCAREEPR